MTHASTPNVVVLAGPNGSGKTTVANALLQGTLGEVIRRRYEGGLWNFFELYRPLATTWRMYDNSQTVPKLIAHRGEELKDETVVDRQRWQRVMRSIGYEE